MPHASGRWESAQTKSSREAAQQTASLFSSLLRHDTGLINASAESGPTTLPQETGFEKHLHFYTDACIRTNTHTKYLTPGKLLREMKELVIDTDWSDSSADHEIHFLR